VDQWLSTVLCKMSFLKSFSILTLAATAVFATPIANTTLTKRAQPQGIDVSGHQPTINWATVRANGVEFAFIKATEGTGKQHTVFFLRIIPQIIDMNLGFKNPEFSKQYTGATNNNIIRGGYHFALPDRSSGAAQATYFAANGGLYSGGLR
jgi:GH25 family lysozyme M1 (1,4-beta-N-acetylmuramidase)